MDDYIVKREDLEELEELDQLIYDMLINGELGVIYDKVKISDIEFVKNEVVKKWSSEKIKYMGLYKSLIFFAMFCQFKF